MVGRQTVTKKLAAVVGRKKLAAVVGRKVVVVAVLVFQSQYLPQTPCLPPLGPFSPVNLVLPPLLPLGRLCASFCYMKLIPLPFCSILIAC